MEMCYDGALVMPSSYAVMSEDEMIYVEGGAAPAWVKELTKMIVDYLLGKTLDAIIKNRKKIWKSFLKQLPPNKYTRATPYYQIFSKCCDTRIGR